MMRKVKYIQNCIGAPWTSLTANPQKAELYAREKDGLEPWFDIEDVTIGCGVEFSYRHALVVFKPELLAKKKAVSCNQFLIERSFVPMAAKPFMLTESMGNLIWRYQWNAASADRVILTHRAHAMCESVAILYRDMSGCGVPASLRAWSLKGSAFKTQRKEESLRAHARMTNRMLGHIHSSDEPADLVRELGIFFGADERRDFITASLQQPERQNNIQIKEMLNQFEQSIPYHPIENDALVEKIRGELSAAQGGDTDINRKSQVPSLRTVDEFLAKASIEPGSWDGISAAANLIQHDRPNVSPVLGATSQAEAEEAWKMRMSQSESQTG